MEKTRLILTSELVLARTDRPLRFDFQVKLQQAAGAIIRQAMDELRLVVGPLSESARDQLDVVVGRPIPEADAIPLVRAGDLVLLLVDDGVNVRWILTSVHSL